MTLTELVPGLYLVANTDDGYGQPFAVFRSANPEHLGQWVVQDSTAKIHGRYNSRDEAIASIRL